MLWRQYWLQISKRIMPQQDQPQAKKMKTNEITVSRPFGQVSTGTSTPLVVKKKSNLIPPELRNKLVMQTRIIGGPQVDTPNAKPTKITTAPLSADDIREQKKKKKYLENTIRMKKIIAEITSEPASGISDQLISAKTSKPKKKVSWPPDDQL